MKERILIISTTLLSAISNVHGHDKRTLKNSRHLATALLIYTRFSFASGSRLPVSSHVYLGISKAILCFTRVRNQTYSLNEFFSHRLVTYLQPLKTMTTCSDLVALLSANHLSQAKCIVVGLLDIKKRDSFH